MVGEQCAMSLDLPPPVMPGSFFFCFGMAFRGAEQLLFCSFFCPFSRVGNFERHGMFIDC